MADPWKSIKRSLGDDYLTARGANPSTGLITPMTPPPFQRLARPRMDRVDDYKQYARFEDESGASRAAAGTGTSPKHAPVSKVGGIRRPGMNPLQHSNTTPNFSQEDAIPKPLSIPNKRVRTDPLPPSMPKAHSRPQLPPPQPILPRRERDDPSTIKEQQDSLTAWVDSQIMNDSTEHLIYPEPPPLRPAQQNRKATPPQVMLHRQAVERLQAHARTPKRCISVPEQLGTQPLLSHSVCVLPPTPPRPIILNHLPKTDQTVPRIFSPLKQSYAPGFVAQPNDRIDNSHSGMEGKGPSTTPSNIQQHQQWSSRPRKQSLASSTISSGSVTRKPVGSGSTQGAGGSIIGDSKDKNDSNVERERSTGKEDAALAGVGRLRDNGRSEECEKASVQSYIGGAQRNVLRQRQAGQRRQGEHDSLATTGGAAHRAASTATLTGAHLQAVKSPATPTAAAVSTAITNLAGNIRKGLQLPDITLLPPSLAATPKSERPPMLNQSQPYKKPDPVIQSSDPHLYGPPPPNKPTPLSKLKRQSFSSLKGRGKYPSSPGNQHLLDTQEKFLISTILAFFFNIILANALKALVYLGHFSCFDDVREQIHTIFDVDKSIEGRYNAARKFGWHVTKAIVMVYAIWSCFQLGVVVLRGVWVLILPVRIVLRGLGWIVGGGGVAHVRG